MSSQKTLKYNDFEIVNKHKAILMHLNEGSYNKSPNLKNSSLETDPGSEGHGRRTMALGSQMMPRIHSSRK